MNPGRTNEKKKILFFIGTMAGGGAERVLLELLKHLDRKKYNLSIAVNRLEGDFLNEIPEDVEMIDRSAIRRSYFDLGDRIFGLSRLIREIEADLVVSFLTGANRSLMRSRITIDRDVKLIIREGNNPVHEKKRDTFWFWKILALMEIRFLYPACDRMIAASKGVMDEYISNWGMHEDQIEVIHNVVDIKRVRTLAELPVNWPWNPDRSVKTIVAVGRFVPQKGFEDLIQVFRRVRTHMNARLVILGQGPLRDEIKRLVHSLGLDEEVYMPGFVENPWAWMSKSDLYLSTSHWEGFHLTIVEAMACGIPPVATDCDYGPREIITDGINGRLVPVGDTDTIAEEVIRLLEEDLERRSLAANALKRAGDFDVSLIVKEYEQTFDEILES